ncbi:MAG TPA: mechanosensitive ion channel domain-containing protein [Candidatus Eisenbacteria bacterium]|nr:mechanosensitive ion channel domain-containing protein [Candidatus Eisenbacteria bacterium]
MPTLASLAWPRGTWASLHHVTREQGEPTTTRGRTHRITARPGTSIPVPAILALALTLASVGVLAARAFPASALEPADSSRRASAPADNGSAPALAAAVEEPLESETPPGYPVILGQRELFRVVASDGPRTAEERARVGSDRAARFARSQEPVDPVRVEPKEHGAEVYFGDRHVFTVLPQDTVGTGLDMAALARERAATGRSAILEYRESRSARTLLIGSALTVLATVLLLLALKSIGAAYRRTRAGIAAWVAAREEGIRKRTAAVVHPSHVLVGMNGIADLTRFLLVFLTFFLYFRIVLARFPWTRPIAMNLDQMLLGPLTNIGRSFLGALPGLVFIGVVGVITHFVIRFLHFLAVEIEAGHIEIPGFYTEWAKPTYNIARVLVVFFAVVVCYPYIPGSNTEAFKGVSIFLGVLLSLGSTSAVSNLVAGFVLTYMRAFRVGDVIQVDADRGIVTEMTLLATRIRTPKNETVTIPNATVLGSRVTNYSRLSVDPGLVLHATVTVGYDAPWRQVHALLLQAAERTPGIKKDPAPFVLQTALEQVQVAYEINAYTDQPDRMLRIYSELRQNIQDAFNEYGVQIMTPFYEGDKEKPLVVPKEKWYAAPAVRPKEGDGDGAAPVRTGGAHPSRGSSDLLQE